MFSSRIVFPSKSSSWDKGCIFDSSVEKVFDRKLKKFLFEIRKRLLNLGVYWTEVSSCECSSGYVDCIFDSTAEKILLKVWSCLFQSLRLIVIICFFSPKMFFYKARLVTQNAVSSNMSEIIHQKSKFSTWSGKVFTNTFLLLRSNKFPQQCPLDT